ncbi:MAG TPA: hypothetical protein VF188_07100 [Longimicrobiales bacterium]
MADLPIRALSRRARIAALAPVAGAALLASACGPKHHLAEYDFRGRTLSVVTIAPPYPEVLTGASLHVDPDNPIQSLFRVGAEIAREVQADRLRARLDSAAAAVDVSGRMAERAHQNAARHLRARPVTDAPAPDYELELRVRKYGIVASSWTSGAYFSIDSEVLLLDGKTGRIIWSTDVHATEPVRASVVSADDRSVNDVVTAIALARMSTIEIERALASLADFAADRMVAELTEALDDVRG